jgi:hypothetical protein
MASKSSTPKNAPSLTAISSGGDIRGAIWTLFLRGRSLGGSERARSL